MTKHQPCIFCELLKDDKHQAFRIYEDADFIAFPDLAQMTEGHILVIPKEHHRWVWDVPEDKIGHYFEVCQKIANKMRDVYHIKQIYTAIMGGAVPHAHIHLIPATQGPWLEAVKAIWALQENTTSDKQRMKLALKLKIK